MIRLVSKKMYNDPTIGWGDKNSLKVFEEYDNNKSYHISCACTGTNFYLEKLLSGHYDFVEDDKRKHLWFTHYDKENMPRTPKECILRHVNSENNLFQSLWEE